MIRKLCVMIATVAVIVVVGQSFGWTGALRAGQQEKEHEVTLRQVPSAVRATILKRAGDRRVEIDEITHGDASYWEAAWMKDGKEVEILVAANGKLLEGHEDEEGEEEQAEGDEEGEDEEGEDSKTDEWEHQVSRTKVPKVVLATLDDMAGETDIEGFAEESENGFTYYEGSWKAPSGRHRDVLVSAAGSLVEIEDGISLNRLPAAVLAAARMVAKGDVEFRAERKTMILYEVKFRDRDGFHELVFGPEGRLAEKSVKKGKAEDGDEDEGDGDKDDGVAR